VDRHVLKVAQLCRLPLVVQIPEGAHDNSEFPEPSGRASQLSRHALQELRGAFDPLCEQRRSVDAEYERQ
jgi:hypothetical protein